MHESAQGVRPCLPLLDSQRLCAVLKRLAGKCAGDGDTEQAATGVRQEPPGALWSPAQTAKVRQGSRVV